jgi:hypothetical protein
MNRTIDSRNGTDRRRREEVLFPWQDPAPVTGRDGPERRTSDRRGGGDRRHTAAGADALEWYSDAWARALGAPNFNAWLDQSARQVPLGLPADWSPAA